MITAGMEYAADHAVNIATSAVVNVRHNNVTKAKSGKDGDLVSKQDGPWAMGRSSDN